MEVFKIHRLHIRKNIRVLQDRSEDLGVGVVDLKTE